MIMRFTWPCFFISDVIPMPTEEICQSFNELRNKLLLLYELKQALGTTEYDLQTLKFVPSCLRMILFFFLQKDLIA